MSSRDRHRLSHYTTPRAEDAGRRPRETVELPAAARADQVAATTHRHLETGSRSHNASAAADPPPAHPAPSTAPCDAETAQSRTHPTRPDEPHPHPYGCGSHGPSRYSSAVATATSCASTAESRTCGFDDNAHSKDTDFDGENVTIGSNTEPSARTLVDTARPSTCSGSHRPDGKRVPPAVGADYDAVAAPRCERRPLRIEDRQTGEDNFRQ